jgi:hypothetical protein
VSTGLFPSNGCCTVACLDSMHVTILPLHERPKFQHARGHRDPPTSHPPRLYRPTYLGGKMEVRETDCEDVTGSMWLLRVQRLHSDSRTIELVRFWELLYRDTAGQLSLRRLGVRCTLIISPHSATLQFWPADQILKGGGMLAIIQFRIFCLPIWNLKKHWNKIRGIILSVVLHRREIWSLALREEHNRLRVFENRVLRTIFGHKRG